MNDDVPEQNFGQQMAALREAQRESKELAILGLRAAVSALAALEVIVRTLDMRPQTEPVREQLRLADEHVRAGLAVLRAAAEGHPDGR